MNGKTPRAQASARSSRSTSPATLKEAVQEDYRARVRLHPIPGVDVNDMKRNLDLLKYSLDYAEALVDTVRDALLVLGNDLRVITANHSFYETFQVTAVETENRLIYELGNGEWNLPKLRVLLEDVLPHNSHFDDFEVEQEFPHIGQRVMRLNARKIFRAVNQTEIILLAIEDISALKNLDRKRDQFVSLVGHELKTPLTVMKSSLQLLDRHLQKQQDNIGGKYLTTAYTQVDRMIELVNGLLDMAKIRSSGFRYREETVDIDQLVDSIITSIQTTTTTHKLIRQGQSVGEFSGDCARIGQVIINLITNALKYSPAAKRIIITTSRDADAITVAVQDFGIGIAKKDQVQIFDPFFQAGNSGGNGFHNIGLGLSIAKDIVEHYGGHLWVNSTKGKGATFCFTLPIRTTDA